MCAIKEKRVSGLSGLSRDSAAPARIRRRCGRTAIVVTVVSASISLAPAARADPAGDLREAVASARGATSCGPLKYNPLVEQAAEIFNQATDDWLMHTGKRMPDTDPRPALQDVGYLGSKGVLLAGAGRNEADAIKGALLQGYAAIPDCSYTDFGVSVRRNDVVGYDLTAAVLAGP